MKVRDILRLLRDDGWYLARTKGSHQQFKHPSKPGRVTLAGAPNDESGKPSEGEIPADMAAAATTAREALIEMVAEADDSLMEKFFEAGTLEQHDLVDGLRRGVAASKIFPLVCVSAAANVGMQPLLDAIVDYVPSPADRPFTATARGGDAAVKVDASAAAPAALFVWKTVADPFAGRITMFRVVSGTVKSDTTVHNVSRDSAERDYGVVLRPSRLEIDAEATARRRSHRPQTALFHRRGYREAFD